MEDSHTAPRAAGERPQAQHIAILGLGEVGQTYAQAFAQAGHTVRGYDPFTTWSSPEVDRAPSIADAVSGADVVLVLTPASASETTARAAAEAMARGIYADCTSSAPSAKKHLEQIFSHQPHVRLVDVAILGPVIQLGTSTPLMAAGPGAADLEALLEDIGAGVEVVDGPVGDAMGHKLLRSVFMKGLASIVTEAVQAGAAAGHEAWIRDQIARELSGDGRQTIDRFLRGTVVHAARRSEEMDAASEYLHQLGLEPTMAKAAAQLHRDQLGTEAAKRPTG